MSGEKIITVPNLSSLLVLIYGIVCLNPYSDLFSKNPTLFQPMAELIPNEAVWGTFYALTGLAGLTFSYFHHRHITARLMFAVNAAFSLLYAIGDYSQPGAYFFGAIALANLLIKGESEWKMRG